LQSAFHAAILDEHSAMIEPDWTKLLMPLDEVDVDRVLSHWAWLLDRPVRPGA
jgi:hypothetical protein